MTSNWTEADEVGAVTAHATDAHTQQPPIPDTQEVDRWAAACRRAHWYEDDTLASWPDFVTRATTAPQDGSEVEFWRDIARAALSALNAARVLMKPVVIPAEDFEGRQVGPGTPGPAATAGPAVRETPPVETALRDRGPDIARGVSVSNPRLPLAGLPPDGQFNSFSEWVSKAWSWIGGTHAICFDAKGRHCAWGAHFMQARDEGAFPVRYWIPDDPTKGVAPVSSPGPKGGENPPRQSDRVAAAHDGRPETGNAPAAGAPGPYSGDYGPSRESSLERALLDLVTAIANAPPYERWRWEARELLGKFGRWP